MDILFGDPFYHNIIHHLSPSDLYNLTLTCTHYKNTIPKYKKNVTIYHIQQKLQKSLGLNYKNFKEQFKTLKLGEIITNQEILTHYNKYFLIIVVDNDVDTSKKFYVSQSINKSLNIGTTLYAINFCYINVYCDIFLNSMLKCFLFHNETDFIPIKKEICKTQVAKDGNIFWLKNDNDKEIFDFSQCL